VVPSSEKAKPKVIQYLELLGYQSDLHDEVEFRLTMSGHRCLHRSCYKSQNLAARNIDTPPVFCRRRSQKYS
jgi:hypothetical protein